MGSYFITRPVSAAVISIVITLIGVVAFFALPTARFPEIAPPNVSISATFTGGNAEEIAKAVASPLERRINGSPGLIYLQSGSTNDGAVSINATFAVGSDLNAAAADVLTRVNRATPDLPESVQRQGVEIRKSSRQLLANVAIWGEESMGFDELFLSNYAETQVITPLQRVTGVGRIKNLSSKRFAIRIWLDPEHLAALGLAPADVVAAVRAQNAVISAGQLGAPPMTENAPPLTLQVVAQGRLIKPEEFGEIVVRTDPDGSVVRIHDIARVELGSEIYGVRSDFSGHPSATISIYQTPGANAVAVMEGIRAEMKQIATRFPSGVHYEIASDRTTFVSAAMHEVLITLVIAIVLVVAVTFLFLQSWRATLIPCIAIPVALVGTFAPMEALGFSLNTLSLLGLVLAVGLVVDDAIVVVENIERQMEEHDPVEASHRAMAEVTGPIAATTIVLMVLFVPVAFIPGITGQLYNQFALTIAFSVGFSGIVSLTLTPALCALLLKPNEGGETDEAAGGWRRTLTAPLRAFNRAVDAVGRWLSEIVGWLGRHLWLPSLTLAALTAASVALFLTIPTGFVPDEDQGYFFAAVQMPPGASIERTQQVVHQVDERLRREPAVANTVAVSGNDTLTDVSAPYYGFVTPTLVPWDKRSETAEQMMARLQPEFDAIGAGRVRLVNPASLPGLGSHGGLTLEIEDRAGGTEEALRRTADAFIEKVRKLPEVASAEPTTQGGVPEMRLTVDRVKAEQLGVGVGTLFDTLGLYVGSVYANLFNRFGYIYQVYLQAEPGARRTAADLDSLTVLNNRGEPVRMGSLVKARLATGSTQVTHYNTYLDVEVSVTASGSSGAALQAITKLANDELPKDYAIEWSDVAYQQTKAGGFAPFIFGFGIVMVFLVLAAQYESWLLPVVVVLTVPLGVLGALLALLARSLTLDIFAQIGLLMLIGLAAKNAILLVAFAHKQRQAEAERLEAARTSARMRLRPILMTMFAFVLGTLPLAIAEGAGANSRISLGTTVIGGMLVATVLTLFLTPAFFVAADHVRSRWYGGTPEA